MHSRISKIMKFGQGVAQNGLFFQVGDTGTPMPFMLLIASLRRPKPDAKIIMAGYGDGADAILMQVRDKDGVKAISKGRMGFVGHQKSMTLLKNYNNFIEFKELINKDRYIRKSSAVLIWRDTSSVYKWYGVKCKNCGTVQYPDMSRACSVCRADDQLERVKLQKKGELFTYTLDEKENRSPCSGQHQQYIKIIQQSRGISFWDCKQNSKNQKWKLFTDIRRSHRIN